MLNLLVILLIFLVVQNLHNSLDALALFFEYGEQVVRLLLDVVFHIVVGLESFYNVLWLAPAVQSVSLAYSVLKLAV